MKCLLVMPPHDFESRYNKAIAKAAGSLPPLGLLYMAAVLKKNNYSVEFFDGSMYDYKALMDKIAKERYDVIGITVMTFLWPKLKRLTEDIKEISPRSFIIIGGVHPTLNLKKCLEDAKLVDALIFGEGEYTLLETVKKLEKGESLEGVKGLIYRKNRKIIQNKERELIKELDTIPFPARELIDIKSYIPAIEQYRRLPVTNIITSRGCPYRCLFCTHTMGFNIRFRSPENIIEEIKELIGKYGVRDLAIFDDTFTVDRKRIFELCGLIKKNKLDIVWSVMGRVNNVDKELLKEMAGAGCWKVFYGVESMLQKNLNSLRKGITVKQVFDAMRWTREAGIESEASFIFGIPGETYKEGLETIKLVNKLNPDYAKFFSLTPYGELLVNAPNYGRIVIDDLSRYHGNEVVFVPHSMTEKELKRLVPLAYKRFYLRPGYIISRILKIRNIDDIKKALKGAMAVVSL